MNSVVSVEGVLPACKENAIKAKDLELLTGLKGALLRNQIRAERRAGVPICSGSCGYWLACDPEDIKETIADLLSRSYNMMETVKYLDRCLSETQGQQVLNFEEQ